MGLFLLCFLSLLSLGLSQWTVTRRFADGACVSLRYFEAVNDGCSPVSAGVCTTTIPDAYSTISCEASAPAQPSTGWFYANQYSDANCATLRKRTANFGSECLNFGAGTSFRSGCNFGQTSFSTYTSVNQCDGTSPDQTNTKFAVRCTNFNSGESEDSTEGCFLASGGECFHSDSELEIRGRKVNLANLQANEVDQCVVPHIVESRGWTVVHSCSSKPLRLTAKHLVFVKGRGLIFAEQISPQDTLFGDLVDKKECSVTAVSQDAANSKFFGLNCQHDSVVLANGVKTSIFGNLHTIPALYMKYGSYILGVERASRLGDFIAKWYLN